MQAGKLRHRVIVERNVGGAQNGLGEKAQNWSPSGEFWAAVEPLSGRELTAAKQVQSDVSHKITLRGKGDTQSITARDRIKFGSRVFEISSATTAEERGIVVVLMCTERLPQ